MLVYAICQNNEEKMNKVTYYDNKRKIAGKERITVQFREYNEDGSYKGNKTIWVCGAKLQKVYDLVNDVLIKSFNN